MLKRPARRTGASRLLQACAAAPARRRLVAQAPGGFTLVELLVAMVVFAILAVLSIPSFSAWIHDEQIRSTAELLQNGLRAAQTDALNRSRIVVFALSNATPALSATPTADGVNWYAQALPLYAAEANLASYTS